MVSLRPMHWTGFCVLFLVLLFFGDAEYKTNKDYINSSGSVEHHWIFNNKEFLVNNCVMFPVIGGTYEYSNK